MGFGNLVLILVGLSIALQGETVPNLLRVFLLMLLFALVFICVFTCSGFCTDFGGFLILLYKGKFCQIC